MIRVQILSKISAVNTQYPGLETCDQFFVYQSTHSFYIPSTQYQMSWLLPRMGWKYCHHFDNGPCVQNPLVGSGVYEDMINHRIHKK
jgi:hypothetical protein